MQHPLSPKLPSKSAKGNSLNEYGGRISGISLVAPSTTHVVYNYVRIRDLNVDTRTAAGCRFALSLTDGWCRLSVRLLGILIGECIPSKGRPVIQATCDATLW